jgi:hypothetical protein
LATGKGQGHVIGACSASNLDQTVMVPNVWCMPEVIVANCSHLVCLIFYACHTEPHRKQEACREHGHWQCVRRQWWVPDSGIEQFPWALTDDIAMCIVHAPCQSVLCEYSVKSPCWSSTWCVWFPASHMVTAQVLHFITCRQEYRTRTNLFWRPKPQLFSRYTFTRWSIRLLYVLCWLFGSNTCIIFAMWAF